MAEQKDISAEGHTNESKMEEQAPEQVREEADAVAEGFGKARQELNEILERVRTEFQKLDAREARSQFARWVSDNPELAVLLAVGSGALVGRILTAIFRPAPPPPLSVRARKEADRLTKEARKKAEAKGAEWGKRAQELSTEMTQVADEWSKVASERGEMWRQRASEIATLYGQRAAQLGEQAARRTQDALSDVAREAGVAADRLSKRADVGVKGVQKAAKGTGKLARRKARKARSSVEETVSRDGSTLGTVGNVGRALVTAYALKKTVQWMGRSLKR